MAGVPVDAPFFKRYSVLGQELHSLSGVEDGLRMAQGSLRTAQKQLKQVSTELKRNRQRQQHHTKKLERSEHHWLFSHTALQPQLWFNGGVPARIHRQMLKLKAQKEKEPGLVAEEKELRDSRLPSLKESIGGLEAQNQRKRDVESQRESMFKGAVAVSPTELLGQLDLSVQGWQSHLSVERQIRAGVDAVVKQCREAHRHFEAARTLLIQAHHVNQGAQFNNLINGSELYEHIQQAQRNQLMHEAQRAVEVGASELRNALSRIPPQAAQRYPEAAAGLGEVHLPVLAQAGGTEFGLELFGGDLGDFIAGASIAKKIQRNIGIIDQCLRVIDQQIAIVDGLAKAASSAVAQSETALEQEETKLATEKQRIFEGLRAAALGLAVPPSKPYATPVATPVLPPSGLPIIEVTGTPIVQPVADQQRPPPDYQAAQVVATPTQPAAAFPTVTAVAQPHTGVGEPVVVGQQLKGV